MDKNKLTWRFPKTFWFANITELLERAAYYGTLIQLVVFLTDVVGLEDDVAGWIGGVYTALIYLFPFFSGAIADKIGFRYALLLAFFNLSIGYFLLGVSNNVLPVIGSLFLIVIGGSFVKPVISGTVAKSSDAINRARAYSIFYMVVNIGSFTGKTLVKEVRQGIGLSKVPFFSAVCAFIAFLIVLFLYFPKKEKHLENTGQRMKEIFHNMLEVLKNKRFFALILITAGFWAIQGQIYAAMPKYVLRVVGEKAAPEWYANINPLVVLLLVVPITHLIKRWGTEKAIIAAMGLIPFSSLCMASSRFFGEGVNIIGLYLHPVAFVMIVGIAIQGVAECFLSPKYLEFASKQAPKGKEGVFLGFAHMNTFFAWLFGFVFSGYLLKKYCPNPKSLDKATYSAWKLWIDGNGSTPEPYAKAHYIWYAYTIVGIISFLALLLFIAYIKMGKKENNPQ